VKPMVLSIVMLICIAAGAHAAPINVTGLIHIAAGSRSGAVGVQSGMSIRGLSREPGLPRYLAETSYVEFAYSACSRNGQPPVQVVFCAPSKSSTGCD
jgi:hypothetical protein